MEVYEITGYQTGISQAGVNYLQPSDSFQNMQNGFIYRQVLQSRKGFTPFAQRLNSLNPTRIFGIFEHIKPNGDKVCLACDKNFLYKFNDGTGVFDQIPFGGSLGAYAGFNISSNEFYVSGTSYPTKTNSERFVFCGEGITPSAGGSAIFYYDGTNVLDFTVDNADYGPPLVGSPPAAGTLTKAKYALWFAGRLNLCVPTISGVRYSQSMIFTGSQNADGDGDKFNVPGAGSIRLDTYENITGLVQLGDYLVFNLDRSNWFVEKTRDAFNPYFQRKVPGVLGTNASFSAVSWADTVKSLGKTGILGTTPRQSLRVDNKIPNFTADQIDQQKFELTYGGFDRINNQFLWAYKESETDTDTQNKVLVGNYEFDTWSVYDMRFSCFGQTDVGLNKAWNQIDGTLKPSWGRWDTTEEIWNQIGLGKSVQKTLAGDDLGYIYQINEDYDDYNELITSITKGTTTVLTIPESAFEVGDKVIIQDAEGMTEINNYNSATDPTTFIPYTVVAATPTNVTINVDSTNFANYTANTGYLTKIISFQADTIPFNPYRSIGRRCYISHVEFLLDTNEGFLKVDVFSDEESTPFKQDILINPTGIQKSREFISMSVDNEANFMTFRLKQESPSTQVRLTNMRIHCKPGGATSY